MRTRFGVYIGIVALVASVAPPALAQKVCYEYTKRDTNLAQRINATREQNNVRALTVDPELSRVARKHTSEMIQTGRVRHTPTDVLQKRVTNWSALGESVLRGSTVKALMRKLRTRDPHKMNLLEKDWRHLGVSVKKHDGRLWATVVYEAVRDPGTTLRMPKC